MYYYSLHWVELASIGGDDEAVANKSYVRMQERKRRGGGGGERVF